MPTKPFTKGSDGPTTYKWAHGQVKTIHYKLGRKALCFSLPDGVFLAMLAMLDMFAG